MNGIDKITARLTADTQAEIDALSAENKAQCEAILQEHQKKAQEEYDRIVNAGKTACRSHEERLASTAELETKKSVLAFKQEMVASAFALAVQKIVRLPEDEYVVFLAKQAAKAAACGEEELILNASDRARVGEKAAQAANALLAKKGLPGKLTVSAETREIAGGLIVRQGNVEVNCSVDTLVQLSKTELSSQVAAILFA